MTPLNNGCHYMPGFFQVAYVTNDLDRAMQTLGEQYGIKQYDCLLDNPHVNGTTISIANAYVGDLMVELIQPKGEGRNIYNEMLPPGDDFVIRHHHMGHLYTSEEELERVLALVAEKGQPIAFDGGIEGVLRAVYVDARPVLGHFLEYIYATPAGVEFLNRAPRN